MDTTSIINQKLSPIYQMTPITDSLFVSGFQALQSHKIINNDISCIICVTDEVPCLQIPNVDFIKLPISINSDMSSYFDVVADKIADVTHRGRKTLVYSSTGKNRSVTLCIAYLMKHEEMTLRQAYHHVKSKRNIVHPNTWFFKQLIEYERLLFGRVSVNMINSPLAGIVPDVYEDELLYIMWKIKCRKDL